MFKHLHWCMRRSQQRAAADLQSLEIEGDRCEEWREHPEFCVLVHNEFFSVFDVLSLV